jgi:hypothetical protein
VKILHGVFLAGALSSAYICEASECGQLEAYAAETVVDYLNNWKNMYLAFRQFKHCDDGAIAEGFSEAVVRLLADQWSHLKELQAFGAKEPAFIDFVIGHMDGTVNAEDLEKIDALARTSCPGGLERLCKRIADATKDE